MATSEGEIFWFNQRWYDYTGTTAEEMRDSGWKKVYDPEQIERVLTCLKRGLETGESWQDTFTLKGRNGEWRWFLSQVSSVKNAQGKITRWFGTKTDLTEHKLIQEKLLQSEMEFRLLADAMPQIVWAANADGYVDYYNKRWYEYTGLVEKQGGDESWKPVLAPDELESVRETWYRSMKTGLPYEREYRLKNGKTGEYRWHLGRALPIRNLQGQILRWYGTNTDIHDQKKSQEELIASNVELSRFAFVASHDLKEPLRIISNYTQVIAKLNEGNGNNKAAKYVQFIRDSVDRMYSLIDDLLNYSSLTNNHEPMVVSDGNILVSEALKNLEFSIQNTRAVVVFSGLPRVMGHRTQLIQVFQNIISNAVKYQKNNSPYISVSAEKRNQEWVFSVADNGIGIQEEYFDKIFTLFKRLHRKEIYPGTGIGLAVCKKIVEMHGGKIWVLSKPDVGSTFYFSLPSEINI